MKIHKHRYISTKQGLSILALLMILLLSSCRDTLSSPHSETHFALGTTCTLTVYRKSDISALETAFQAIDNVERLMSVNLEDSEIAALNRAAGQQAVSLSSDSMELLSSARRYAELSRGAFDPTVGPLASLWGIGTEEARIPENEEIGDALELVDYQDLKLYPDVSKAYLKREGMRADLGAIAKGFAADQVVAALEAAGVQYAMINLGGNVFAMGERMGNGPWRIGVQNPDKERGKYLAVAQVENEAVVTSGKYERFFIEEGQRYHHILSTLDGYPIENGIASVSIVDRNSTRADAFSTLLFALGLERGLDLAMETPFLKAVFVMEDGSIYTSEDPRGWFSLKNSDYHFAEEQKWEE